jgi:hypothetical protein
VLQHTNLLPKQQNLSFYTVRGNRTEAIKWAEDACDAFERLGMPPDIREMQGLIKRLKAV